MVTTRNRKVSPNNKSPNKPKNNKAAPPKPNKRNRPTKKNKFSEHDEDLRLPERNLEDDISEDMNLDLKKSRKSINLQDTELVQKDQKNQDQESSLNEDEYEDGSLNDFIVPDTEEESSYNPMEFLKDSTSQPEDEEEESNENENEEESSEDEDKSESEDEEESGSESGSESEYDPNKPEDYEKEFNKRDKRKKISIMFLFGNKGDPFTTNSHPIFDFNKPCNKQDENSTPDLVKKRKRNKPTKPVKPIKRTKTNISDPIKTLDDLIILADKYPDKPDLEYAFDIKKAKALQAPLKELKDMIGLQTMKEQIVNQIKFIISGLKDPKEMFHTVITGSPGCGKTTCGLILSKIYRALGYSNGKFRIVKRSDLVGEYLGHTAAKTQRVIDSIRGGVLFIDEAYSLGNQEGRDSFSKEAIDTLNQNLSMDDKEQPEFICIVAGYKDELESCFFSMNPGLARRFTVKFDIGTYNHNELQQIFLKKIELSGWSSDPIPDNFFKTHENNFKNKGADMVSIAQKAKICHTNRVFGFHQEKPRHLTVNDLKNGLNLFLETESRKESKDEYFHKHIKPTLFI